MAAWRGGSAVFGDAGRRVQAHARALAVVCAVVALSALGGALFAPGPGPDRVTGVLTHLGPTEFTLESAPGEATSPVCGCFKIKHRKDWRGVTFATRKVEISRDIGGRASTYQIFAATPEAADWAPSYLFFGSELWILRATSDRPFDPDALVRGQTPSGWSLVRRRNLGQQPRILLTTSEPLDVSMLGPTPIGAWIPSRSGRVALGFHQGLTADAPLEAELREHDVEPSMEGSLSHPLADFLGPDVAIWTGDPDATIETENSAIYSKNRSTKGRLVAVLLIRRPPFATRVAALPLALPQTITPPEVVGYHDPYKTGGPYRLKLTGKPLSPVEYGRMQTLMRIHNVFTLRHLTGYFPAGEAEYRLAGCEGSECEVEVPEQLETNWTEEFRYPPRPPAEEGFTVFGPLRSLQLSEAEGAFSSLDHPLSAPTEMRLREVEELGPTGDAEIPVPAEEAAYRVDISASGSSKVAGAALSPDDSFDLRTALVIAGILTGFFGLFFGALAWFGRGTG